LSTWINFIAKFPRFQLLFLVINTCFVKQRNEVFSERLVSGETEPVSTSGANVVNADPDATQPFLDEIENDAPVVEPPKEDPPSLPALVGDAPYVGLQRKRRRN
jgi:hypothetical protein